MEYPTLQVDLSNELKEIEIIGLGDVHYGSPEHNAKLFDEIIEKIKTQDNLYCILLGDLIECVTKDSVGDLYTQKGTPQTQANYIIEKLKPIKDKILAMTGGNHENRVARTSGFDINYYIAWGLGIEERYIKDSFVLFVKFGKVRGRQRSKQVFSIFVCHGFGGSTKKPSKLKKLVELKDLVTGCDAYLMGHIHDYICTYEETFIVNVQACKTTSKTSCFVSQGAFLDFGGYGYEKGYKPLAKRYGIITMGYECKHSHDEKYIYVKG